MMAKNPMVCADNFIVKLISNAAMVVTDSTVLHESNGILFFVMAQVKDEASRYQRKHSYSCLCTIK